MYRVYILECRDGTLYTGIALNVDARFKEHVRGVGAKYTASHPPKRIVYRSGKLTQSAALKREYTIKRMTRVRKKALIRNS